MQEELKLQQPYVEIVTLCNRLEGESSGGLVHFAVTTLKSMYHMATSSVCVLDAYWPAVSILKHNESLTVIQMWHALGKIKQSGYQTLGRESGRSADIDYINKNFTKLNRFTDVNDSSKWYFADVNEAANEHIGITTSEGETWTKENFLTLGVMQNAR